MGVNIAGTPLAVTTKFSTLDSPTMDRKLRSGVAGSSGSQASSASPIIRPRPLCPTSAARPRIAAT